MVSKQLLRALTVLGIRLTHSKSGQPRGRGKIERFFRTVREQFLVELAAPGALASIEGLSRLNELFTGWVETVYHQRVHSETGQAPLARLAAADLPALTSPALLREAFLWSEHRQVTKTATVSLHGNSYEVDAALIGRRVELVFDPFDLTELTVRYQGRDMGVAIGHQIGRHVHPAAKPEAIPAPVPATSIDYLGLVQARHTAAVAHLVDYAAMAQPTTTSPTSDLTPTTSTTAGGTGRGNALVSSPEQAQQIPGQLDLLAILHDPTPNPTFPVPTSTAPTPRSSHDP